MVRRNRSPLSGLSDAEIEAMARQFRAVLHEQFPPRNAGAAGPAHPPFDGQHSHPHGAYGHDVAGDDGQHDHVHQHDGDADHDHPEKHAAIWPEAERPQSARYRRHVRLTRDGARVLNSAQDPRRSAALDAAFADLARTAAQFRRTSS
jgi:hypothetical protein